MTILTMNMSSYEIERIDVCAIAIDECADWYPEAGLQQYPTCQSRPVLPVMNIDPDTFINSMYNYQQ